MARARATWPKCARRPLGPGTLRATYLAAALFVFDESDDRMSDRFDVDARPTRLGALGVLRVAGVDARTFLQGQLSANLDDLTREHVLLASCNSAQGRVQAVLWLASRDDGVALALPASLIDTIAGRLRKYVLRSKVKLEADALAAGVVEAEPDTRTVSERAHVQRAESSVIHLPGHTQHLVIAPPAAFAEERPAAALRWRQDQVAAGLPQVYPETHEAFVAQMLNLDILGGVSFNKGCYTGQEIIARAHYRGAVKRRMFRFAATCDPPAPAARIVANAQHAGDVVDSVATEGGCELLAVVSLSHIEAHAALSLESGPSLRRLPLPYSM